MIEAYFLNVLTSKIFSLELLFFHNSSEILELNLTKLIGDN